MKKQGLPWPPPCVRGFRAGLAIFPARRSRNRSGMMKCCWSSFSLKTINFEFTLDNHPFNHKYECDHVANRRTDGVLVSPKEDQCKMRRFLGTLLKRLRRRRSLFDSVSRRRSRFSTSAVKVISPTGSLLRRTPLDCTAMPSTPLCSCKGKGDESLRLAAGAFGICS